MSGLAVVALVLAGIWLGILTLVVVLLVRQIGLLTVRLSVAAQAPDLDNDGPEVGSNVPEEVASALPEVGGERAYVLLISASCTPCRELAAGIHRHDFEQTVVALVPGDEELADELAALLPSGVRAVRDPEARRLAGALGINSTPFAVEVERGTVTRKAYLYDGASDLMELVEAEKKKMPSRAEANPTVEVREKQASERSS